MLSAADWERWHAEAVAAIDGGRFTVTGIVASWGRLARPLALRIGNAAATAGPGEAVVTGDDGRPYLLAPAPPLGVVSLRIENEWAVVEPSGTRYRVFDPLDGNRRGVSYHHVAGYRRRAPGRRAEWRRSGPQPHAIARALAVRGLMETGLSHGAALRTWVQWPEADPPPTIRETIERMARRPPGHRHLPQAERDERAEDRGIWTAWERGLHREHRRIWEEVGVEIGMLAF